MQGPIIRFVNFQAVVNLLKETLEIISIVVKSVNIKWELLLIEPRINKSGYEQREW
jgi:hypothetical protein